MVTKFRLSDPWKHPNANPPAFPYRDISGKAKCFCKREWARKVSVLLKQGYLFCMSQIFPSRISCSSNKRCFDSSVAVCQELLPTQPAWLRICKGSCKVAALILTLFLVLSFIPFFKTKGEGERGKGEKKKISSLFLPPLETLQFTGAVSCPEFLSDGKWESTAAHLIHFRNEPWLIGQIFPIYQLLPPPG